MPKPRTTQIRSLKRRILILCEGKKTEPYYFKGIKESEEFKYKSLTMELIIHDTKKNTAKELVKETVEIIKNSKREGDPFDEAWVVFDKDGYTKHPEAFDTAKNNKKIKIAFSSISFEYWILLHFKYTTKAFSKADNIISEINKCYKKLSLPSYDKCANNYDILKKHTDTAIKHAIRSREFAKIEIDRGTKIYNLNPYTDVDILICTLLKEEKKP